MAMTEPVNAPLPSATRPPHRRERTTPLRSTTGDRIGAGILAGACLAVLAIGAWLTPNASGHGTHTQLGMTQCMWAQTFDRPCPTCGMTTSFSYAGDGHWVASALTQPMGVLLVLLTAMVFWGALMQAVTGARIGAAIQPALRPRIFLIMGLLLLGSWGYKIMTWHAA